jgi:hypothetical protein
VVLVSVLALARLAVASSSGTQSQLERGRGAILSLAGCYLVDYSYTETKSLKPGTHRDERVYDVNKNRSVKEWITAEELSPTRLRLQHVLFATSLEGRLDPESLLKHQVEDWEYQPAFLYEFERPMTWSVKPMARALEVWVRRITALDDGLRYQCAAPWSLSSAAPEWACANYAPIPGRETRDMGRKDYNTLERFTRVIAYGPSWLERQANTKTIDDNGARTPLAEEVGKTWYVRLPDSECREAKAFTKRHRAFWKVLRETWDEVLDGKSRFTEFTPDNAPPRYARMHELEERFSSEDLSNPTAVKAVKKAIKELISTYRRE